MMAEATTYPDIGLTEEQRDARSRGVGGSDMGALIGVGSVTALDLYLEKTGKKAREFEMTENAYFGHVLEPVVAGEFTRRTGIHLEVVEDTLVDADYPFMVGNIDRRVVGGERAGFEAKAWSTFSKRQWGEEIGSEDVPAYVAAQCAHYMRVGNFDVYYVGVLLGGNDFRWYKLIRRPKLEAQLVEICRTFWIDHVEARVPPPAINQADLKQLYATGNEGLITATSEIHEKVLELGTLQFDIDAQIRQKEQLKFEIQQFMGNHNTLVHPEEITTKLVTWNKAKDGIEVNWPGLVGELAESAGMSAPLLKMATARHSTPSPGSRRFLPK